MRRQVGVSLSANVKSMLEEDEVRDELPFC
jgi:hypothetical protein